MVRGDGKVALPLGATHDLTAARRHGIPDTLIKFGVACYPDNAYRAAGPTIAVRFRRRPRKLSTNQKKVNRNQAPSERAVAAGLPSRHHGLPGSSTPVNERSSTPFTALLAPSWSPYPMVTNFATALFTDADAAHVPAQQSVCDRNH